MGIGKFKFLSVIYLICLLAYSVANFIGIDVQTLYRVPFLSIKWIDVAILIIILVFFYKTLSRAKPFRQHQFIVFLCFIYLIFEVFQLTRSWGLVDSASQISHFLCTLSLFIVIDLAMYPVPMEKIVDFLKLYAILGAIVLSLSNLYLVYSFIAGNVVYQDLNIRVALEVEGSKETIYSTVLTPLVYAFGLYFIQKPVKFWIKALFVGAILSIYVSLIITFYRGTFITIVVITLYFLFFIGNKKQAFVKVFGIATLLFSTYLLFGELLGSKGYDPLEKIVQVAKFTADTDDPNWDKGRSVSQEYALKAWRRNYWTGAGYDELYNYSLPSGVATAHNGVITSLFHRGVIGTAILLLIFIILFKKAISLWPVMNREKIEENELMKLLILVSFFWIISFMTQEALWEKFSMSIQYLYLGLVINVYNQKLQNKTQLPVRPKLSSTYVHKKRILK